MGPGAGNRRLSLQQSMSMMRSEPNIHRRCSLDPSTLKKLMGPFEFHQGSGHSQTQSLGRLPLHPSSPSTTSHLHSSPHGSNSHLSNHGSNSSLNDQLFPTFTPSDDPVDQGRSKSLGNIFISLGGQQHQNSSPPLQQTQQQAAVLQVGVQQTSPSATGLATTTTGGTVGGNGGSNGTGAQKRRSTYGFNNLTRGAIKRPRCVVGRCAMV